MGYNILLFTDLLDFNDDKNSGGQFQLNKLEPQALTYNTKFCRGNQKAATAYFKATQSG